jgi:hypothetical protein
LFEQRRSEMDHHQVAPTAFIDDELHFLVLAVLFTLDPVLSRHDLIRIGRLLAAVLELP